MIITAEFIFMWKRQSVNKKKLMYDRIIWFSYPLVCQLINVTARPTTYMFYPFNGYIKTAQQRTIIQQYGDWSTGRRWVGCYILYSEVGPGRAAARPSPLLALPNVTAHPQTASVPTLYYSM